MSSPLAFPEGYVRKVWHPLLPHLLASASVSAFHMKGDMQPREVLLSWMGSLCLSNASKPHDSELLRLLSEGSHDQLRPWTKKLYRKLTFRRRVSLGLKKSSGMVIKKLKPDGSVSVPEPKRILSGWLFCRQKLG